LLRRSKQENFNSIPQGLLQLHSLPALYDTLNPPIFMEYGYTDRFVVSFELPTCVPDEFLYQNPTFVAGDPGHDLSKPDGKLVFIIRARCSKGKTWKDHAQPFLSLHKSPPLQESKTPTRSNPNVLRK
jgi:hypothetical protein